MLKPTILQRGDYKSVKEACIFVDDIDRIVQCMSLKGPTGTGKTTLIKDYARQFPRYETQVGTRIPIFYLETASPVTVKGLVQKMLEELGDPAAHKGSQPALNSRLIHL